MLRAERKQHSKPLISRIIARAKTTNSNSNINNNNKHNTNNDDNNRSNNSSSTSTTIVVQQQQFFYTHKSNMSIQRALCWVCCVYAVCIVCLFCLCIHTLTPPCAVNQSFLSYECIVCVYIYLRAPSFTKSSVYICEAYHTMRCILCVFLIDICIYMFKRVFLFVILVQKTRIRFPTELNQKKKCFIFACIHMRI